MLYERPHIKINFQEGPIQEVGVNGCQLVDVLQLALDELSQLNERFPCSENVETIRHLNGALSIQAKRTADRIDRGVEGYQKA